MDGKGKKWLKTWTIAAALAGVIIVLLGVYYIVIKAGIPYQDPTPELQMKYAVNMEIGDSLLKVGGLIFIIGILLRAVLNISLRRGRQ